MAAGGEIESRRGEERRVVKWGGGEVNEERRD